LAHQRASSSWRVRALKTLPGAAAMVRSSTMAGIVVPFRFHVALRLYLTYRLSIEEKGNGVKGLPGLQTFLLCLDLALWSLS
jgi:hypothetical protein